jgi:signal transduction histidine kinase
MEKARRRAQESLATAEIEEPSLVISRIGTIIESYEAEIPVRVRERLGKQIERAISETKNLEERVSKQVAVLSSLATAGMSALAYQHELNRQLVVIQDISAELHAAAAKSPPLRDKLLNLSGRLDAWAARARETGRIFSHLRDPQHIEELHRYKAKVLVDEVREQVRSVSRGVDMNTDGIDPGLRLPRATYAEWIAVFQNVVFNALNAIQDSRNRRISVSSVSEARERKILVQDTGVGVDVEDSERLFLPFIRDLEISEERRELGFGGTGLGLTIVRMICERRGCKVYFSEPMKPFSSCLTVDWREV